MGVLSPDCTACRGIGYVKPGYGAGIPTAGAYGNVPPVMGGVPPMVPPTVTAYPPAYGGAYMPPQVGYGYGAAPFY